MSKNLQKLDELIPQYAVNKSELDSYKKICDKENAEIKSIMTDLVLPSYDAGDYVATCSVSERESFNEEILISLFDSVPGFVKVCEQFEIIKSRPYIDFDALEKAIYDEALSKDQLLELEKAKEVKTVTTLRVKRKKKEDK